MEYSEFSRRWEERRLKREGRRRRGGLDIATTVANLAFV